MPERPTVPVRFTAEIIKRLDAVRRALAKRAAGAAVSRSEVVRLAVERGLPALEREAGIKPPKRSR